MKKKLVSIAMTLCLLAGLSVQTFAADGETHTIVGDGYVGIGSTVNPGDNETSAPPTINAVDDDHTVVTGTGIAGSAIKVRFANNTEGSATVADNGKWTLDVPASVTLVEGQRVYARQLENRTYTDEHGVEQQVNWSDEVYVVIGSGEGSGITDPGNPDDYLNIVVPATFSWAVDETSAPNIVATTQRIYNLPTTIDGVDYGSSIKVTLKSFGQTAGSPLGSAQGLTLKLNGDLALNNNTNLADGLATAYTYSDLLETGDVWAFSFEGAFEGSIPATALQPAYKMVMHFSVEDITQL